MKETTDETELWQALTNDNLPSTISAEGCLLTRPEFDLSRSVSSNSQEFSEFETFSWGPAASPSKYAGIKYYLDPDNEEYSESGLENGLKLLDNESSDSQIRLKVNHLHKQAEKIDKLAPLSKGEKAKQNAKIPNRQPKTEHKTVRGPKPKKANLIKAAKRWIKKLLRDRVAEKKSTKDENKLALEAEYGKYWEDVFPNRQGELTMEALHRLAEASGEPASVDFTQAKRLLNDLTNPQNFMEAIELSNGRTRNKWDVPSKQCMSALVGFIETHTKIKIPFDH